MENVWVDWRPWLLGAAWGPFLILSWIIARVTANALAERILTAHKKVVYKAAWGVVFIPLWFGVSFGFSRIEQVLGLPFDAIFPRMVGAFATLYLSWLVSQWMPLQPTIAGKIRLRL